MHYLYTNAFLFFVLSSLCWAGVASNPFLRPGSNRPPPQVHSPPPPPQPAPNPAFANEVEFRGYFLLKGVPHFCIFNKKANFGEWIKLTEKTYEEFHAQAFDLETETLTLAFNGQNFTLSLEQSKSSSSPANASPTLPKVNLPTSPSTATNQRIMPPRPKSAPQLPDWLANRVSSRTSSSSTGSTLSRSRGSQFVPPPRSSAGVPNQVGVPIGMSQPSGNSLFRNSTPTSIPSVSAPSSVKVSNFANPSSDFQSGIPSPSEIVQDTNLQENVQSDLDDLPPPPPPPNILPPSPPPDILPSLDD